MTERSNKQETAITKRLDVIIRLLLEEQRFSHKTSKNEQLLILHSSGLTPSEIASVIGWELSGVTSALTRLRKKPIKKSEMAT